MNYIRFAGISLNWDQQYAKKYCEKLIEMGYCTKIIDVNPFYIVSYAHKPFSVKEACSAYKLLKDTNSP